MAQVIVRNIEDDAKAGAGIVRSRRATLATRNVWHFDGLGREAFRQLSSQTWAAVRVVGGLCYSTETVSDPVSEYRFRISHMEPPLN